MKQYGRTVNVLLSELILLYYYYNYNYCASCSADFGGRVSLDLIV